MKRIVWIIIFIMIFASFAPYNITTTQDDATGVSIESLERIQRGMRLFEVQRIIGRESDEVFEIPPIVEVEGI